LTIQTLKASSVCGVLALLAGVFGPSLAMAQQAGDPAVQYVIRSDGVTQTYAAISIDNNVSTYIPLQPGDVSYPEGELVSPGLNYVPPVVLTDPAPMPPSLMDMSAKSDVVSPVVDDVALSVPPSPDLVPVGELVAPSDARTDAVVRGDECVGQVTSVVRNGALNIVMGDLLSDQIGDWARERGYAVYWEADQYRAGGALTLNKGFEETLRVVRDSLQQSGIDLTMTIYSNCVVRVTEAK
jgi:hypothetical protein